MYHICKLWIGLLPVKLDDRLHLKALNIYLEYNSSNCTNSREQDNSVTERMAFWALTADCRASVSPAEHQLDTESPSHFCRLV